MTSRQGLDRLANAALSRADATPTAGGVLAKLMYTCVKYQANAHGLGEHMEVAASILSREALGLVGVPSIVRVLALTVVAVVAIAAYFILSLFGLDYAAAGLEVLIRTLLAPFSEPRRAVRKSPPAEPEAPSRAAGGKPPVVDGPASEVLQSKVSFTSPRS